MTTVDLNKKFDPTPEENRAAMDAIKAELAGKTAELSDAIAIRYGSKYVAEARAKGPGYDYRIAVAEFPSSFIGLDKAKQFADTIVKMINEAEN